MPNPEWASWAVVAGSCEPEVTYVNMSYSDIFGCAFDFVKRGQNDPVHKKDTSYEAALGIFKKILDYVQNANPETAPVKYTDLLSVPERAIIERMDNDWAEMVLVGAQGYCVHQAIMLLVAGVAMAWFKRAPIDITDEIMRMLGHALSQVNAIRVDK